MATDSLYMALAGERFEEVVRPEQWEEFQAEKHKWFPRTQTPESAAQCSFTFSTLDT